MPKIQKKNKIEQCTKIFIYRDLKQDGLVYRFPCDSVKFIFGCDWKPLQGRVIMSMS